MSRRKKPAPTADKIFSGLQQAAGLIHQERLQQIKWERNMSVIILSILALLGNLLIPSAYTAAHGLVWALIFCACIPLLLAHRLLQPEKIAAQVADEQRNKACQLSEILSGPHLCHLVGEKARIFRVQDFAGAQHFPTGEICIISRQELGEIRRFVKSSCIQTSKKPQGFSLVEVLGIITIVALLVILVLPGVMNFVQGSKDAAQQRKVQTLNLAVEQARIQKYDPVLDSTDKHAVYQYLIDNNFLIKGQD